MISNDFSKNIDVTIGERLTNDFPINIKPQKNNDFGVQFKINSADEGYNWKDTDYLLVEVESEILSSLKIQVEFFTDETKRFNINTFVMGSRRLHCVIPLYSLNAKKTFLPTQPGQAKTNVFGKPTPIDEVDCIKFSIQPGRKFESFTIHSVTVCEKLPELKVEGRPAVDKLGQYTDFDWEGKMHSEKEMAEFLKSELEWAKTHDFFNNPDFDEYGGYKKLNFGAKGHFYSHYDGKRFWLVDPLGNAYFSNAVCYPNRAGVYSTTECVENMFEWLPPKDDPVFKEAWCTGDNIPEFLKRQGYDSAHSKWLFNFPRANMIRVFGENWHDAYCKITSARLKQWGFNSIGIGVNDYDDEKTADFIKKVKIPYCFTLRKFPKTENLLFRDFPDVFSEEYKALCEEYAKQIIPFKDDPYFIGYFVANEPEWLFQPDINCAGRAFLSEVNTATKLKLIEVLKEKYKDISSLNCVWGSDFESFESLKTPFNYEDFEGSLNDFKALLDLCIEEYTLIPVTALKKIAPGALSLGMRYHSIRACNFAGGDNFDVFSYNCYSSKFDEVLKVVDEVLKRSFILGEWHIGSSDMGLMSNALVNATTQKERGKALAEYERKIFNFPKCVGMHYFEYNDQPVMGRFDGENMQIGLVDVCEKPYYTALERLSKINYDMYEIMTGEKTVSEIKWEFNPRF